MFESLELKPKDPILKLAAEARNDPSPQTVDLSVGVYKTEQGETPIFKAIKIAEQHRLDKEHTKTYMGILGDERFNQKVAELVFGRDHSVFRDNRISSLQSIGGSGALFIAGRLLCEANPDVTVWAGDPTWGNHIPLLTSAGVKMERLPYYDQAEKKVDFDAMMAQVAGLNAGDVLLLHGCCHNPTGADLSHQQWDQLADQIIERGLIPFVDIAYHGLATDLDTDAFSWRMLADRAPEMLVAYSCSKNFGLYRDRIGLLSVISKNAEASVKTQSNLMSISRATYSMPAAHGAYCVAEVLDRDDLRADWTAELAQMRDRVVGARQGFANAVAEKIGSSDFDFVTQQNGMFSFLGLTPSQIDTLKREYSIYMVGSSRVNVAGLTESNIDYVASAIASVLPWGAESAAF